MPAPRPRRRAASSSPSSGRRPAPAMSASAPRTSQSRNRASTARDPNLTSTAIGSVTRGLVAWLFELEPEAGQPEHDRVAGLERGAVDAAAVHLHAVGRAEVGNHPAPVLGTQLGVPARDVRVLDRDV